MGSIIRTNSGDTLHVATDADAVVTRLQHAGDSPVQFETVSGEDITVFGMRCVESVRATISAYLVPKGTVPELPKSRRVIDTTKTGKKT